MQSQLKRKHKHESMNLIHSGEVFSPCWGKQLCVALQRFCKCCTKSNACCVCLYRTDMNHLFIVVRTIQSHFVLLPFLVCGHLVELISLLMVSYLLSQVCLLKQYHPPKHTHKHHRHTQVTQSCVSPTCVWCVALYRVHPHLLRRAATSCCL